MTNKLIQYAVVFEPFEEEGLTYVKQGCGAVWTEDSPVKVFDTQEDAQKEGTGTASLWIIHMVC